MSDYARARWLQTLLEPGALLERACRDHIEVVATELANAAEDGDGGEA
jgi:hypothetical protein